MNRLLITLFKYLLFIFEYEFENNETSISINKRFILKKVLFEYPLLIMQ